MVKKKVTLLKNNNKRINISANKLISSFSSKDKVKLNAESRLKKTKKVIVRLLGKRSLSISQLFRVARKYDENLPLGLLEQAVHELMVHEIIDEITADKFTLTA